jgi:hypothetical protein
LSRESWRRIEAEDADAIEAAAADEGVQLIVPTSLVEQVVDLTTHGIPAKVAFNEPILHLNSELIDLLVRDSILSVTDRVRVLNENIIAEVETSGEVPLEAYAEKLKIVTDAERLASRVAEIPAS